MLLSLAVSLDWPLHQLDVKNASLNGDLEKEVCMDISSGIETEKNTTNVCKVKKSLYVLKQSFCGWFDPFKSCRSFGPQCQSDHTLLTKDSSEKNCHVYEEDIILLWDHEKEIGELKGFLGQEFEIKDLGNFKYFLGMEIARSKIGISVSQRKYVLDLLKET